MAFKLTSPGHDTWRWRNSYLIWGILFFHRAKLFSLCLWLARRFPNCMFMLVVISSYYLHWLSLMCVYPSQHASLLLRDTTSLLPLSHMWMYLDCVLFCDRVSQYQVNPSLDIHTLLLLIWKGCSFMVKEISYWVDNLLFENPKMEDQSKLNTSLFVECLLCPINLSMFFIWLSKMVFTIVWTIRAFAFANDSIIWAWKTPSKNDKYHIVR